jgi:glycosyltransferase involved in cell wall biosynthesis
MMAGRGYDVTVYANEGESDFPNTVGCSPEPPNAEVTEPEWTTSYFAPMNERVIAEMGKRIQPHDLILLSTGHPQRPIADAFPNHIAVEACVGYEGTWSPYRVFESHTWRQTVYGWEAGRQHASAMNTQGRLFDETIFNFFDLGDFPKGDGSGGYLLFLGRIIPLKGIEIAVETSRRTGIPLVIAGPGTPPDYGEYVGVVGPERRAELMGAARAIMTPTLYLEPFGGAAVEGLHGDSGAGCERVPVCDAARLL